MPPLERNSELSAREAEVAELLAEGLSNKEIGLKLTLSAYTVRDHVQQVVRKLGGRNRVEAAVLWRQRAHPRQSSDWKLVASMSPYPRSHFPATADLTLAANESCMENHLMNATELNASTQEDLFAELTNDEVQAVSGGTAYDTNYGSISPNPTTSYLGDGRWQTIFHVTRQ